MTRPRLRDMRMCGGSKPKSLTDIYRIVAITTAYAHSLNCVKPSIEGQEVHVAISAETYYSRTSIPTNAKRDCGCASERARPERGARTDRQTGVEVRTGADDARIPYMS